MRTKNAKRLWPVPATLAVVALAAFLAFGLLATTGAQPATAQDTVDCIAGLADDSGGTPPVPQLVADDLPGDDSNDLDCSVHGSPAVIAVQGSATLGDDGKVIAWVYVKDGTIQNGTALSDVWDHSLTAPQETEDPIPATAFSARRLDIPGATQAVAGGGPQRSTVNVTVTPASGKSEVAMYIYYAAGAPIPDPEMTGFDHDGDVTTDDVKRLDSPMPAANNASGTMNILILGPPSLTRPDAEQCFSADDQPVMTACDNNDHDSNMDNYVDHDKQPDPASDLYVLYGQISENALVELTETSQPDNSGFASESPYNIRYGASSTNAPGVFVETVIKDMHGNLLTDTGNNKAQSRVTFDISYASGSALASNPITPAVVPVSTTGTARTQLDHWKDMGAVSAMVTATYSGPLATNFDLGSVMITRGGDAKVLKAGTFSIKCLDDAATPTAENYVDDKVDLKNEGCDADGTDRFGGTNKILVKAHLEDSLLSIVDGPISVKLAEGIENPLATVDPVVVADPVTGRDVSVWVYTVSDEAMLGDHTITVSTTAKDVVAQTLTVTVAGPPHTLMIEGPDNIALNGEEEYTISAVDVGGGAPYFKDMAARMITVATPGIGGEYVIGINNNMVTLDENTGTKTITVYAPADAVNGRTARIIVGSGDMRQVKTITFGAATPVEGEMVELMMPTGVRANPFLGLVNVEWTAGQGAHGHAVLLFNAADNAFVDGDFLNDPTVTDHTFKGVASGDYYVIVAAYQNKDEGGRDYEYDFLGTNVTVR